ncbi:MULTISPECIES: nuclear transport factor 2 family protein [unclassified Arsukibacterium]|uniref:nuclear transport factor 2 family protein n=1 Tax=unclassified Arsukibacterium TaxID=2635278 RepID=UPI000C8D0926|nr:MULTISPECIES: nuclear transport factor 2 family protein [unclassified Arsukibacterium]MAA95900.1 steroid delta-isomerase [Rheinheimera sp.]HAW92764.1 steroid delta-isomerase [Candidatus Azambacteria bacterium]|tara:strand:+ start:1505 stop:1852 length:348 start_codon:yes stop_codon:yes gene_type:complete
MPETQPELAVQRQLDAYNAKDLAAFIACYHPDIAIYRMPASTPSLVSRDALAAFYQTERFMIAGLRAEVLNRMVVGNKVIDHERVYGITEQPYEVVVVYQVQDGLILNAWFYPVA